MKQYTVKEMIKIIESNGYVYERRKSSHLIYVKKDCNNIVIVDNKKEFNMPLAKRIIKENNLVEEDK